MNNGRMILKLTEGEAKALMGVLDCHLDMQSDMLWDNLKDLAPNEWQERSRLISEVVNLGVLQGRILQMLGR